MVAIMTSGTVNMLNKQSCIARHISFLFFEHFLLTFFRIQLTEYTHACFLLWSQLNVGE